MPTVCDKTLLKARLNDKCDVQKSMQGYPECDDAADVMLYSKVYKSVMDDRVVKSLEEGKTRIDTSQGSGAQ
jgi:hypothetical protein